MLRGQGVLRSQGEVAANCGGTKEKDLKREPFNGNEELKR